MKADKHKKPTSPDLRQGVEGSVLLKDANENFAGKAPSTTEGGAEPVNPGVGEPVGQVTHE
jgi:hypothetical protein